MNRKVLWILFFLLAVGGVSSYVWRTLPQEAHPAEDITDLSALCDDIGEEMREAQGRLPEAAYARVIVRDETRRAMALVVAGLPERTDTMRLLDILERHQAKAVFFVEGDSAALQPETIRAIAEAGQAIGNYTYVGMRKFQELPPEAMLGQLLRTQKTVYTLMGRRPTLFYAPQLRLTPLVLQAVTAAGVGEVVWPNVFLARHTLHSADDADAWAATVPQGSIIAIPGGQAVDILTPQVEKTNERPAIDKKPNAVIPDTASPPRKKEALAEEVDRMLTALEKRGFTFWPAESFRHIEYVPEAGWGNVPGASPKAAAPVSGAPPDAGKEASVDG
ncbi:MAG: polysaccharide deacetylase family protein [Schwartzia sp. (in: firmicutes)]